MKRLNLIILTLASFNICSAQEFGTIDSKWVYNYLGTWTQGVTFIQFHKDTSIDGILTKIFKKNAKRFIYRDRTIMDFELKPIYIRSIDGIVTTSEDALNFDTLYNFKAEIGRSWYYTTHENFPWVRDDTITMTIMDTFRINVAGKNLFAQAVRFKFKSFTDNVDTVYEYIGAGRHYILPFDEEAVAVDGGEGGILRCFTNEVIGLTEFNKGDFQNRFSYDCMNLTDNENIFKLPQSIQLGRTVFEDILTMNNLSYHATQFKVFNIQGKLLFIGECRPGVNQIDLSYLSSGMHIIHFEFKGGIKIIKL